MERIIVVGGGIAGLSAAAALSETADVTVLEAEAQLGYHASGRSAAMFLEDYGSAPVRALSRASAAYHRDAGVLAPRGLMLVGTAEEAKAFAEEAEDLGLAPIGMDEAQARMPILSERVRHAAWREDAFDLDTDLLLQGFARQARANGADIVTGVAVQQITREGGVWTVRSGDRAWQGALLVNAAGGWADGVAAMAGAPPLGIQPCRRSMAVLPAPGGHDVSGWPFLDGVGESWYAKPQAGKWLVSPADEDPVEPQDAWADDMVLAEGLERYEAMVTEPVTRLEGSWAGLRSFAPDRALVLGPDPAAEGFVWCAGQGGYGMQTAPAAGRLVADLVFGRRPELEGDIVRALSPARFR